MKNNKRLGGALFSCALLIVGSLSVAPAALAQNADADESTVEEIVVLGSRIRRDEYSSAAPLQTFRHRSRTKVRHYHRVAAAAAVNDRLWPANQRRTQYKRWQFQCQ